MKKKLASYRKEDIIVKYHSDLQAWIRQVNIEEVKENIVNPEKLVFVEDQGSMKYNCYFAFSDNLFHRYILKLNGKVIIVTIIVVNRNWQRAVRNRK